MGDEFAARVDEFKAEIDGFMIEMKLSSRAAQFETWEQDICHHIPVDAKWEHLSAHLCRRQRFGALKCNSQEVIWESHLKDVDKALKRTEFSELATTFRELGAQAQRQKERSLQ